jgi:hypothetical protein
LEIKEARPKRRESADAGFGRSSLQGESAPQVATDTKTARGVGLVSASRFFVVNPPIVSTPCLMPWL